jgi:hypothetical protein
MAFKASPRQSAPCQNWSEAMMTLVIVFAGLIHTFLTSQQLPGTQAVPGTIERGDFRFSFDERGISALANPHDPFGATLMPAVGTSGGRGQGAPGGRGWQGGGAATIGLTVSYRAGDGDWTNLTTRGSKWTASPETGTVTYTNDGSNAPLKIVETYKTDGNVLDWLIDLESTGKTAVREARSPMASASSGPTVTNSFARCSTRRDFSTSASFPA